MKILTVLLLFASATPEVWAQGPWMTAIGATRPRTVTRTAAATTAGVSRATVADKSTPQPVATRPALISTPVPIMVNTPAPPVPPVTGTLSMEKVRARLTEAQRMLKARPVMASLSTERTYFVTVTALEPEGSRIHLITLPKESFLSRYTDMNLATSYGTQVRFRVVRSNYVNTAVTVTDGRGRHFVPLLIEYPIEKYGAFREMAYYTSAHPAIISPDVVRAGQNYVRNMVDMAARRLKAKGYNIPASVIETAERLCVVEHIDHDRFMTENRLALFQEVYALYGLNELNTYQYSVSSAGAGGMVQMIPPTYRMVRNAHPAVGLHPDFVTGMRNHNNALEAMLLYMNDTWNDLVANSEVNYALTSGIATSRELMSAGYNSNPARLPSYLRRASESWRTAIPRETQVYITILQSLDGFERELQRNRLKASLEAPISETNGG